MEELHKKDRLEREKYVVQALQKELNYTILYRNNKRKEDETHHLMNKVVFLLKFYSRAYTKQAHPAKAMNHLIH